MTDSKTILIVEDDPINLKLLRDVLQFQGYRTFEATNGRQAVEMARSCRPDLILMDVQLPVMSGIEATKSIRLDQTVQDVCIVALTAIAMPGDREMILAAGCNDYIAKPVHIQELLEQVARHLENPPIKVKS